MSYPSTFKTLQDAVIGKLRLEEGDRSLVKDAINQVYAQTVVETEALQKCVTMTLTSGSATYTLPTAVIRIKSVICTDGSGSYQWPLQETPFEEMLSWRQGTTPVGTPTHYSLLGKDQLELWPNPDSAYTLKVYEVYLPTTLSADGDTPELQEPWNALLLQYGALAELADFNKDPSEAEYRALYDNQMRRFRIHLNRRRGGHTGQLNLSPRAPRPSDRSADWSW